jgi:hypothetical protein
MFGEQVLRMIAGLLVGIWVARYLGPEQFGVFSYATAFVAIFSAAAKLGLDGIVVRDLVKEVIGFEGDIVFDTCKPDGTMRKLMDSGRLNRLGRLANTGLQQGLAQAYAVAPLNEQQVTL